MPAAYVTGEGLRHLLIRLRYSGPDAWREDPEAAQLMEFCIRKYGALARKHQVEPEDAAVAAFEVMRTRAARVADDPWAVVTRAVQITLIADERAHGLLTSTARARRASFSAHHDAERFSDRETAICEYHPAFHLPPEQDEVEIVEDHLRPEDRQTEPTSAFLALDTATSVLTALGWPTNTAASALDYIAARIIESGTRTAAHEMLRRDPHARALFDLSRSSWATLLRVVLGAPGTDHAYTAEGHGLLLRLLIGESVRDLLTDDRLVHAIATSAPPKARRTHV